MTDKKQFQKIWTEMGDKFSGIELTYYVGTEEISGIRIYFSNGFTITLRPDGHIIKLSIPEVIKVK